MTDERRFDAEVRNLLKIQSGLLPQAQGIPSLDGIDLYGDSMQMYGSVGGDHVFFVNFRDEQKYGLEFRIEQAKAEGNDALVRMLARNKKKIGVGIVDVAGHNITDAAMCGAVHVAFKLAMQYELDAFGEVTIKLFERLNTLMYFLTPPEKYFTMLYGEISSKGRFRFLSAGHPTPIVYSREFGKIVPIDEDRLVTLEHMGLKPSEDDGTHRNIRSWLGYKRNYTINEINLLSPGDIMVLCSDGVIDHARESDDPSKRWERYSEQKLEEALRASQDYSANVIYMAIMEDALEFAKPQDDMSLVVIKRG